MAVLFLALALAIAGTGCNRSGANGVQAEERPPVSQSSFVANNGQLQVVGSQLCNQFGQPVQLKGMSSHGIAWFPQFVNKNSMQYLRDDWGATVFRVAMYTQEGGGYTANPAGNAAKVEQAINDAVSLGIYVIVDWHILADGDPNQYKSQAKEFFGRISAKYKDVPNVIYEICNEPNGNVKWNTSIKPYAEEIIPVIRGNSPKSVILVGTGTWSQDILEPANHPLAYDNVMYVCHFYAGTHKEWLRDRIAAAMDKGIGVFVSEWGTTEASGNGGPYPDETKKWLAFLDKKQISWCNWSLCDKNETSAALVPGANPNGGWGDNALSLSGKLVRAAMRGPGWPGGANAAAASNAAQSLQVTGDIQAEMCNGNTGAMLNSVYPRFKLTNTGSRRIGLANLKIRYFYTVDGDQPQNFFCDWSNVGSGNVTGNFVKMISPVPSADCYLEVGFTNGAGDLESGKTVEVQARFAKVDWSSYNQANDFSFCPAADGRYATWNKISVYLAGTKVFGTEPL